MNKRVDALLSAMEYLGRSLGGHTINKVEISLPADLFTLFIEECRANADEKLIVTDTTVTVNDGPKVLIFMLGETDTFTARQFHEVPEAAVAEPGV